MRFLPLVGLILLGACVSAKSPTMSDAERRVVAEEIHQQTLGWMRADSLGDMAASLSFFVEDSEALWVSGPALFLAGRVLHPTKASVGEWFSAFFTDGRAMRWSLGDETVAVISPDYAIQVFEGTYSIVDGLGNVGPAVPATVTTAWVRRNGAWRILHCHQT